MAKSFPNTGATVGLAADRTALTSPFAGMQFFETDTYLTYIYDGTSWRQVASSRVEASGGNSTATYTDYTGFTYKVHSFTSTGNSNFIVTKSGSVSVLVVAGGGGGGYDVGGGGGAGGEGAQSVFWQDGYSDGGPGRHCDITGIDTRYASGGRGAADGWASGATSVANSGNGGDGGGAAASFAGAAGIVIIRYIV